MKVRIKKLHPDAIIPKYAHDDDAGLDLTAVSMYYDTHGNICYGTGLAFEIPRGYVGLVFPRSSCAHKQQCLANAVAVIDSGYRGEVVMKFKPSLAHECKANATLHTIYGIYGVGERIAQMIIMPYPYIEFEETDELSVTERNDGRYGSTGA